MKDEGFNVKICTDKDTGFSHGGNALNCGTWMDKMGSAQSNRGIPSTPRDGAPVEIVGLMYSVISFFAQLNKEGAYHHQSVSCHGETWTYENWAAKIKDNFEKCFWVPVDKSEDSKHIIRGDHINRRGIYKDSFGSSHGYTDYQLRCNVPIAMAVAPEIFNR